MRAGVWWSAATLLVIAVATSTLLPSQVESARTSRRLSTNLESRASTSTEKIEDTQPTFRSRSQRRREEPTSTTPRDNFRSRGRSRVADSSTAKTVTERSLTESSRNEGFDSRRTNRVRSRPIDSEVNAVNVYPSREIPAKSKTRQSNRRSQYTTTETPSTTPSVIKVSNSRRAQTLSTELPLKVSSQDYDNGETENITPTFDDITRTVPKEEDLTTTQFKRRSSTARSLDSENVGTPKPLRARGRINRRTNVKLEDMASSGATNVLTISEKNGTPEILSQDKRTSRKLRYRSRFSQTETNVTSEDVSKVNEISKSTLKKQAFNRELENGSSVLGVDAKTMQSRSERKPLIPTNSMRVVRRPFSGGKEKQISQKTLTKVKPSDEIGDDDNYPETFKALIQAKNASTQVSSPTSESLPVKATHTVINTYTQTSLPSTMSPNTNSNNNIGLRSKLNITENEVKGGLIEDSKATQSSSDLKNSKSQGYRLRGTYSPRPRKLSKLNAVSGVTTSSSPSPAKGSYKFTRKLKTTTIEPPKSEKSLKTKRFETGQSSQKSVGTSFNTRRSFGKSTTSPIANTDESVQNNTAARSINSRVNLPRTSYYSRSPPISLSTEKPGNSINTPIADKKIENTAEMPLIYTLVNNQDENDSVDNKNMQIQKEKFLIAVNSKESNENNVQNEIIARGEGSENMPIINVFATTQKYHSNYKDQNSTDDVNVPANTPITPAIRNIQTRKYNRKFVKSTERVESTAASPGIKVRENRLRKYSDTFSKTTEASNNGITLDSEKPKSRFSSKYRASYLNKPFYKPTVPTVTPTTAWLKVDAKDHQLTKFLEEPKRFKGNDCNDVTSELTSRHNMTAKAFVHLQSSKLEVGEEIQLGPDMNAISFTQSRSTLSSADLRLSESLVKPSHVMNVEASNHSPSVTVSIFDALAEILTSTPRIQISSTTEVPQQTFTDSVAKQTLNGVSSNKNVNSAIDLSSQGTPTSTDSIKTTISVQITDLTTPIVLNRLSVGESSPSLNTEDMNFMSTSNPPTTITPTPTTPISARKPFAIKLLYSDTESPTDLAMTSSTTELTTKRGTTDNPKMVYNTVSDLLLSNNNLVSAELTSMLSNNIKDIIENMDEESRSRLSVEMANLLKTLIPRATNKFPSLNDIDSTTPYCLEDIRDTENIDIGDNENSINLLQNVSKSIVNISQPVVESVTSIPDETAQNVNSTGDSQPIFISTLPEIERMTTVADISTTPVSVGTNFVDSDLSSTILSTTPLTTLNINGEVFDTATLSNIETLLSLGDSTNKPDPDPFFTNSNYEEFILNSLSASSNSTSLTNKSDIIELNNDDVDIEDPSQITRLQLWILSKKARVLKMIEQIIRDHNKEIENPPLTEVINRSTSVSLSNRLSDIINTKSVTTMTSETSTQFPSTKSTAGLNSDLFVESSTRVDDIDLVRTDNLLNTLRADFIQPPTTVPNDVFPTTTPLTLITEEVSNTETDETEYIATETAFNSTNDDGESNSTTNKPAEPTTIEDPSEISTSPENIMTSTENTTVTTSINTETTLFITESSTESTFETTTQPGIETTTVTLINEIKSNDEITITNRFNAATQTTIPKKDYVIFGILPNNTVVRKDPNDNVLETLTEASPYIVYGVLPNNTVIRKFPNGTRVPRIMQKIDVLPISPWSLRNPYSPIHNNPAIVRPQSNPIRVSTNNVTSADTNNEMENRLTTDTVNNQQMMVSSSALNVKNSSFFDITTATTKPFAEKSTASHVLSLRTTTMLPSIHEILLNSISSATKEEMVISSMTSSTREPRILTLDIDPETKQIRTEKPGDERGNTVFKFIPIDEVTVTPQNTNVLKLASTKTNTMNEPQTVQPITATESNLPLLQIETRLQSIDEPTTTTKPNTGTPSEIISIVTNGQPSMPLVMINAVPNTTERKSTTTLSSAERITEEPVMTTNTLQWTTTQFPSSTIITSTRAPTATVLTTMQSEFATSTTVLPETSSNIVTEKPNITPRQGVLEAVATTDRASNVQKVDNNLLQKLLDVLSTTLKPPTSQESDQIKLLQTLLLATGQTSPNLFKSNSAPTTTLRSIKDDLRQFEEDTKLLKALLQATGHSPNELKMSTLNNIKTTTSEASPTKGTTANVVMASTTTSQPNPVETTTKSILNIADDIKKNNEDILLLQSLLKNADLNSDSPKLPVISGITSNVRIASNPFTTAVLSNPTTQMSIRPVYTTFQPTEKLITGSEIQKTVTVKPTLQDPRSTVTEDIGISTTYRPITRRTPTSTISQDLSTLSGRRAAIPSQITTEVPSTSTFSDAEDLAFLNNLKSVLNTNTNNEDPEAALANRVIALAVERSLSEIQTGKQSDPARNGKTINLKSNDLLRTTTIKSTTTMRTTTITTSPPEIYSSTPSLEDDIKQFEEDTKLLQALLQATGQDPSKFNIPTLPSVKVSSDILPVINEDLRVLSNLLASPSPLNEPFDPLTQKPASITTQRNTVVTNPTTAKPPSVKIAVKDNLQNANDDAQLLKTLIKLKDAQETTTQRNKIAITGQSSDEALKKLIQQAKPTAMVSEATKSSVSLSTEYGNSNDALLAALLKEQGFGPTTASSLDEQIRLAALLNQVVVTPKARRTTTLPPPPPAPRRPILDGLAWLWQQWRETAPGSGESGSRPNRRPAPTSRPSAAPTAAPPRANWFGSGPFVGNADDRPPSNRIPLEPPRAVAAEQSPGRGQLVSAAINVTRAFSQFLGAAIQGAAQTVQNVIRAGQKAATDVYTNGSG